MTEQKPSFVARIVLGAVAVLALSIPTAIVLSESRQMDLLDRTAATIQGSITGKQCSNHGTVFYSYVVHGIEHKNSGRSCGFACEGARVGDRLPIIYSTEKPELSRCNSLGFSRSTIHGNMVWIAIASIAAAVIISRITRVRSSNSRFDADGSDRRAT